MAKVWSFNTTIRNPERMENMLRALSQFEGQEFDAQGQEAFFGLQIKKRLYRPERTTLGEPDLIAAVHLDESGDDIDDDTVERILAKYRGRDVDGSGRGRTAAGILNRFGLCVALQSKGAVVISDLAKKWLKHEIDDEELFTKFFLKWQYPNEIEAGYEDFDIKPFVGTLSLISKVNERWGALRNKPVGLSKLEYQLFVPALVHVDQVNDYAERIVNFRTEKEARTGVDKTNFIKQFSVTRVREIYGEDKSSEKALSDLRDYTDSSVRYFRVSGLLALRGGDTHIDIAKDKEVEVVSILQTISVRAEQYGSYEDYFAYLNDINALELPWRNEEDLNKISAKLTTILESEAGEIDVASYITELTPLPTRKKVDCLEEKLNDLRIRKLRGLKHNVEALDECIEKLESITSKNYETLTARPSLDLEWYAARALMVLNDAVEIAPSFNMGDDGIPTGFRSNTSDIECYYSTFGMTIEATLLLGRDQWYAEGQPVMRHLRDFEDKLKSNTAYCIFLAPFIHRDTLNTFWGSNTSGYEGKKQIIIPLTLTQFVAILKIAKKKISGGTLTHQQLKQLFESFTDRIEGVQNPHDWLASFAEVIERW
ncbi:MAG: AlwI family type II restriction endonuclease [Candidatus Moranbacteria bacterium]|nr:AlwI family type II restriction endonuclease [Candidatus Moranbacteria bacterium]